MELGPVFDMTGLLDLTRRSASGTGPALVQGRANADHGIVSISPN